MRPLRYSINVTLDGCIDHTAMSADAETHRHATETLAAADALIFGRVTYGLMEFWREASETGVQPEWMADWMVPFAKTIGPARKYLVSSTVEPTGWNTELLRGDPALAVRRLKEEPGKGLYVGGVTLPLTLAAAGLIDEYEFIVHPRIAGRGPTLFAGLQPLDLRLVGRTDFSSGAVALRYEPKR